MAPLIRRLKTGNISSTHHTLAKPARMLVTERYITLLLSRSDARLYSQLTIYLRLETFAAMSRRAVAAGFRPATRRASIQAVRQLHRMPSGGLLRADASIRATRKRMWFEGNSFHNAVIARNASFARFLPKLMVKFAKIPAMFGGLAIAAFAWLQYQANRMLSKSVSRFPAYTDSKQRLVLTPSSFLMRRETHLRQRRQAFLTRLKT